jgi:small-conductance mechanosensitive channel
MNTIKDFLYYELVSIGELDFTIAPVNLIFMVMIVWAMRFTIRFAKRSIMRIPDGTTIVGRNSEALFKLIRNLIYITGVVLIIQSFNVNNNKINFSSFLEYELISIDTFSLSVYNILLAFGLMFLTRILLNVFQLYMNRNFANKEWIDEGKKFTIFQLVRYAAYTIVIIMIVRSTGVQMSLLLTSAAALFVGVGLGLQTIFADLLSGFIMLFDGSVKVGDVLEFNEEPVQVQRINIRYTLVERLDESLELIPNSKLTTSVLRSRSNSGRLTRYGIKVSVAYGSDLNLVRDLLVKSCKDHKHVSHTRKPRVFLDKFGDNGLELTLYFWMTKDMLSVRTKSEIRFEIDRLFRENGVTIPFPQRDLHIVSDYRQEL